VAAAVVAQRQAETLATTVKAAVLAAEARDHLAETLAMTPWAFAAGVEAAAMR
jgi:hypothetical protein